MAESESQNDNKFENSNPDRPLENAIILYRSADYVRIYYNINRHYINEQKSIHLKCRLEIDKSINGMSTSVVMRLWTMKNPCYLQLQNVILTGCMLEHPCHLQKSRKHGPFFFKIDSPMVYEIEHSDKQRFFLKFVAQLPPVVVNERAPEVENPTPKPDTAPVTEIANLVFDLNPLVALYSEIGIKPEVLDVSSGRFTLISSDPKHNEAPKLFHVHCTVMQLQSVELRKYIDGNLDGIRDGEPLVFECSPSALDCLLKLIYLQNVDDNFELMLPEIVEVAYLWKMDKIVQICLGHMENEFKQKEDYDVLLSWFVSAHKCELGIEHEILKVLFEIVKKDKTHLEPFKAQLIEYSKVLSPVKTTELMLKLMQL